MRPLLTKPAPIPVSGASTVPDHSQSLNLMVALAGQMRHDKEKKAAQEEAGQIMAAVSNANLDSIMSNPESREKLLRLYSVDKNMAAGLLDILRTGDQMRIAQEAQEVEKAKTFYSNVETILQAQGDAAAKNFVRDTALQRGENGEDISVLKEMLTMDGDQMGAFAMQRRALAGEMLEIPEVKGANIGAASPGDFTIESLEKYQETGNIGDLERVPEEGMTDYQRQSLDLQRQRLAQENKPSAPSVQDPSPKDFTVESIAKYQQTGNAADLVRYTSGTAKRNDDAIDSGLNAARALPTIKRSLDLLNSVKTSGFANTLLAAKQYFGVDGADEGELSANLGKAVLSQLRDTFGAQFTEREGARLERIEAGFGRSVETNKRLLGQLSRMMEQKVKTAKARAANIGDDATIAEIEAFTSMDLSEGVAMDELATPAQVMGSAQISPETESLLKKYGVN